MFVTLTLSICLAATPPLPDYAKAASWAVRPGTPSAADAHPPGVEVVSPAQAQADVFFIHPTSYFGMDLNAAVDDETVNRRTDSGSIANQASVFNGCCRIFAPRYRQAALSTYVVRREEVAERAWKLAYADVKRAFDYYIQNDNGGRPFIIAGHSQGSPYVLWLLQDAVEGTALRDRFVAAYVVGDGVPEAWFSRNLKTIGVCKSATDTGCVLNWSTFGPKGDPERIRTKALSRYGASFEINAGKPLVCTNPLSWSTGTDRADASLNHGAWAVLHDDKPTPVRTALTGARCENGALFTDKIDETNFKIPSLPGQSYHLVDYQLFYMNIRENAVARVKAFVAAHPAPH